jgi:RNA polymerase-binding protein DksA
MPEQKERRIILMEMTFSGKVRRILRPGAQKAAASNVTKPMPAQTALVTVRIGNEMPSKAAGSSKAKAGAPARGSVTKAAAKAKAVSKVGPKTGQKTSPKVGPKTPPKATTKAAPRAGSKSDPKAVTKTGPKAAAKARKAPATPVAKAPPTARRPAAAAKTSATRDEVKVKAEAAKPAAGRRAPAASKGNYDKDSLGTIRKRLVEQRGELQDQLTAIEESALGLSQSEMSGEVSYDEDFADAGSFTFEREKEFSIANNVTDLRSKIDRALHKIEEGSYGICESCGQPIEAPRLKALPHATLCLKCKKAEERR